MTLPGFSSARDKRTPARTCAGPVRGGSREISVWPQRLLLMLLVTVMAGCASGPDWQFDASQIEPLRHEGEVYTLEDAFRAVPTPDLLGMNDAMRDFVELHTQHSANARNRLLALHSAIKSPSALDMQYEALAEGNAQEVFERGSANCLSYAHMFVAMAREAGLNARYQWMEVRPEWHRIGERVAVRLHVNVTVRMRNGDEYMIDIDPLSRHEVAGSRVISDFDAQALYHNNQAMALLAKKDPVSAWMQVLRSLELAPGMSHLWVNLGAIYRYTGQHDEAEKAYLHALEVDKSDRSAMNNLVVLYDMTGRQEEEEYWLDRLRRYRERNPYYHSNLGDIAGREGDWDLAFKHYRRAISLQTDEEDSQLIYGLGLIEYRRGNLDEATRLIRRAIDGAVYEAERDNYRAQLQAIAQKQASI